MKPDDEFYGWQVGDRCDHNVPGRSRSSSPYDGHVSGLEMIGDLPFAWVHWPDGEVEALLVPEYITPSQ